MDVREEAALLAEMASMASGGQERALRPGH